MKMLRAMGRIFAAMTPMASALAAGAPGVFAPNANGQIQFTVPSHNIECTFTPAGGTPNYKPRDSQAELSCDRAKPEYVSFTLGARGKPRLTKNPGEQPCCISEPVLAYGSTWKQGPFSCASTPTGLTCKRADGRGFLVSKSRTSLF